jgi:NTE family protein
MATASDDREYGQSLKSRLGQVVLVFQGGGALGAYQAGVYEALHEAGVEPDWVIGTSIGAINAAVLVGNEPGARMDRLRTFWRRVERMECASFLSAWAPVSNWLGNLTTLFGGLPNFFAPEHRAFLHPRFPLGPESAGYYSTAALKDTLTDLVELTLLNRGAPRITVGAANVKTGNMHYFDSRNCRVDLRHIMASGALPPAFPAVRVDEDLYWDGGILSNTPIEAVFDDNPRRNSLVFSVQMWHPRGPEPSSIWDVISRQKDVQYASRTEAQVLRQKQIHRLRHIIGDLSKLLPDEVRTSPHVKEMAAYGCVTRMHVVRLLAPPVDGEDHTKDIDFSGAGIRARWSAGLADTRQVLAEKPWERDHDPLEGFILHEHVSDSPTRTS